jgi:recombination protein RecA
MSEWGRARILTEAEPMAKKKKSDKQREKAAKQEVLDKAIKEIEARFGTNAIKRFGDMELKDIEAISTGSITLDHALGVGGVPRGRIIEIFGPESSGKTTLTLHLVANAQKEGVAAFIDAEHALDPQYAQALGVDTKNLLLSQPDSGEQALEICETLVRSSAVDIVVVDSVAALVPQKELEGDMGDTHVGLQARLMSQALRKLTAIIARSNTTVVFINQIREKVGVSYGSPETTPGGRALKFYSSVRVDIRRIGALKDGDKVVGNRTRVKVVKNKVAPPFKTCEFDIVYGKGISRANDVLNLAVDKGVVDKKGAWFAYNGENIGQGKERSLEWLAERPEVLDEIEARVRAIVAGSADPGVVAIEEEPTDE